ncbi:MAG: hypothetical protein QOD74_1278 [Variibacter sp.]|jgi:uncharacterized iron-regulated membrane protein|nr:hypothetical protein [Variibacter sp.]
MPPQAIRDTTEAWPLRLARFGRKVHKWVGVILALLMLALSVTGIFVAYKNEVEYLQPRNRTGAQGNIADVIPPARVAEIVLAMRLPEAPTLRQINRIELRPSRRMYKVRLEPASAWSSPREIQVDAMSGAILNDGLRGDQLWMDLHSLAVFGGLAKLVTMTVSGLALIWLSLSGFYMFFYPRWFKARARREASAAATALGGESVKPQPG